MATSPRQELRAGTESSSVYSLTQLSASGTPSPPPEARLFTKRAREIQAEEGINPYRSAFLQSALSNAFNNPSSKLLDAQNITGHSSPISSLDFLKRSSSSEGSLVGHPSSSTAAIAPNVSSSSSNSSSYRRPRAGTLPSNIGNSRTYNVPIGQPSSTQPPTTSTPLPSTSDMQPSPPTRLQSTTRIRSGSLTLPPASSSTISNAFGPSIFTSWIDSDSSIDSSSLTTNKGANAGSLMGDSSISNEDIMSHVKTLDYLGLDEPSNSPRGEADTPLPPLPSILDLRRDSSRIRSYSVSAKERYDEEDQLSQGLDNMNLRNRPVNVVRRFVQQQQQQTRPRAISLGTLDGGSELNRNVYSDRNDGGVATYNNFPSSLDFESNYTSQYTSHSTPRGQSPDLMPPTPPAPQNPTRSLWIGNLDSNVTTQDLMHAFSPYGNIESLRVLPEKECGFVNFFRLEDAMLARDDIMNRLGGRVGTSMVRIGYGKADSISSINESNSFSSQSNNPTRALWVGNIPTSTTPAVLLNIFSAYGPIESARVLTHKNCGFVNFERLDDAVRARKALNGKELMGQEVGPVRIGFAKVPVIQRSPATEMGTSESVDSFLAQQLRHVAGSGSVPLSQQTGPLENYHSNMVMSIVNANPIRGSGDSSNGSGIAATLPGEASIFSSSPSLVTDQRLILRDLCGTGELTEEEEKIASEIRPMVTYYTSIPLVPEPSPNRKYDALKLRDIRKRLDNGHCPSSEVEILANDMLDECVELSSDYIGNTVIQKLFEKCSDAMKTKMLERIGPHLAMIGIHKHGTWAAQKIIDCSSTPEHMQLIMTHLKPYTPPLLLDQFGNYVVQCCLRLGLPYNQFMFDSMIDRCWEIAQGRFGSRAMRACLESSTATRLQQTQVAIAIVLNSVPLSTNANGALLLTWFLDSSNFPGRYRVLVPRLVPHLAHLCTHKLASLTVLKLVNQRVENEPREVIFQTLFFSPGDQVLEDVLSDQVHGVGVVQKILTSAYLEPTEKKKLSEKVKQVLTKLRVQNVQGYRRLMEEVGLPFIPEPTLPPTFPSYGTAFGSTVTGGITPDLPQMSSWPKPSPPGLPLNGAFGSNAAIGSSFTGPTSQQGSPFANGGFINGRKSTSPDPRISPNNSMQTPPPPFLINGVWYLPSQGVPIDRHT